MSFKVNIVKEHFKPGDPMARDMFSMGMELGNDLIILYRTQSNIKEFEIVDMKTGDTIFVTRETDENGKDEEIKQLKHDCKLLIDRVARYEDALVRITNANGSVTTITSIIASL